MDLTVLAMPGCPGAAVLERRLAGLLAGRPDVTVTRRVIADAAEAARCGMRGSPTLLIDGRDPFPARGPDPVMTCRLYPSGDGRLDGAPSLAALREALGQARRR